MSLIDVALQIAGKDKFKLDKRISPFYIFRLFGTYGMMIVRGKLVSIFYSNISHSIFLGKKVKLYEKRYMTIGMKSKIHDFSIVDALSINGVIIGSNVVLGKRTSIECTGSLQHIGKGLVIGDHTTFGSDCFFGAAGGIEIGNDVMAGQYIRFHSENHNYSDENKLIREQGVTHQGIKIGNNCWIGAGAIFLDGASLGNGCVVAANAVITKKFPDNSVIGGVPAKILKYRGQIK